MADRQRLEVVGLLTTKSGSSVPSDCDYLNDYCLRVAEIQPIATVECHRCEIWVLFFWLAVVHESVNSVSNSTNFGSQFLPLRQKEHSINKSKLSIETQK